ncbi:hypothetical protein BDF14DRAFT_1720248 [Spinellus fusiger]|nr:hypothetical protein BDF14DRAFT_1720248 [Spinellus fusiger]
MEPLLHAESRPSFGLDAQQLVSLVDQKDLDFLDQIGGIEGLARLLCTHPTQGLSGIDSTLPLEKQHSPRTEAFGMNLLPVVKQTSLWQLVWTALKDKTLILLMVAAMVSLSIGIYQDTTTTEYDANGNPVPGVKWVEGVAILMAILLVVVVGSVNDYSKEKQFRQLNAKKQDRLVNAIREGVSCVVPIQTLQVGDVLRLEPGDIVPADGVYLCGHSVQCDESDATGESDTVKKTLFRAPLGWSSTQPFSMSCSSSSSDTRTLVSSPEEKEAWLEDTASLHSQGSPDPFFLSGAKVLQGTCTYMVTAVGVHSFSGRTEMSMQVRDTITPLQEKLNTLAHQISLLGSLAGGLLALVLLARCAIQVGLSTAPVVPEEVISHVMHILITAVTVVVVAVPEGLPLAVTLALAYATRRMLKDNNLVRVLASCETMGNATTICTDKTGTLTQNKMTVVAGMTSDTCCLLDSVGLAKDPVLLRPCAALDSLCRPVSSSQRALWWEAIATNSTAFQTLDPSGHAMMVGSRTETALLTFAAERLDAPPFEFVRTSHPTEHVFPFSSTHKCMGTLVHLPPSAKNEKAKVRLHIKGAPDLLVPHCVYGEKGPLTPASHAAIAHTLEAYAHSSLRTLALAYCDFDTWPGDVSVASLPAFLATHPHTLTLLGVVGIQDPLRPDVAAAVRACQGAGVCVRMVTGDSLATATAIAQQAGLLNTSSLAMEGSHYRSLSPAARHDVLPRLHVLARATPHDKRLLVEDLKHQGEVVAVTGDGTNDGPALRAAHVGFSMGLSGTEVAKEASSIVLMDDTFSSIVKAVMWGRCVHDAVKKFLQFQMTVNITAVALTLVSSLVSQDQVSVLTAVQLLWVNLIMDTFAALALATDAPTADVLERAPASRYAPLVDTSMWRMILGQAVYQIVLMLVLLYTRVMAIEEAATLQTFVFTTFVFCQIFNQINCRRIDSKWNVFHNIHHNPFFLLIFIVSVGGQVVIVQWGGAAFQTVPLSLSHWMTSAVLGAVSLLIGLILRWLPEKVSVSLYQPLSQDAPTDIGTDIGTDTNTDTNTNTGTDIEAGCP